MAPQQQQSTAADAVVVGAGPAGLAAARTLARLGFQTILVEQAAEAGLLTHICNALVVPASGPSATEPAPGGLYFPQVDLVVPESLVVTRSAFQTCLAPGGERFETIFDQAPVPALLLDKPGLLRLLARQAAASGATLLWDTAVVGLLFDGDRVAGVRTMRGDIRAGIVLSAEGAARHLCEQADLYPRSGRNGYHLVIGSQELEAPLVSPGNLGRIVTLGRPTTSAPTGYGTLLLPASGRAIMTYTMLLDDVNCSTMDSAWRHLAEYAHDPRVAGLLGGARVLRRSSFLIPVGRAPDCVVRQGFMGVGDAISPAGYLGILPALYLGRQAALVAAGALDAGNVSAEALMPFDDFFRQALLPGLEAEARATMALVTMQDAEIDRLCTLLNALHLPVPFLQGSPRPVPETVAWLGQQLALDPADLDLVGHVFGWDMQPNYQWAGFGYEMSMAG
jgi:flavin-dependent dehydrogenase